MVKFGPPSPRATTDSGVSDSGILALHEFRTPSFATDTDVNALSLPA